MHSWRLQAAGVCGAIAAVRGGGRFDLDPRGVVMRVYGEGVRGCTDNC